MMRVILLLVLSSLTLSAHAQSLRQGNNERRQLKSKKEPKFLDPKSTIIKDDGDEKLWRKFVKYESSEWEELWLENIEKWAEEKEICEVLESKKQMKYVHDFLNLTCSVRYKEPHEDWCIIDDQVVPMWYNSGNRKKYEIHWENPLPKDAELDGEFQPVVPTEDHEHIVSKFTFKDETTGEKFVEYIEPLVSHLRFPLCHCVYGLPKKDDYKFHGTLFRGWIIPPPPDLHQKHKYLFDAGASDWNTGVGGPSLKYFFNIWQRSGHEFEEIYAYELTTTEKKFMKSVPKEYKDRTHYQQCVVSSQPEDHSLDHPFLPKVIKQKASNNDYVLFKLDIDSPKLENGNIDYILEDEDTHIDELVWEHHISGNYLMKEWGSPDDLDQKTLKESYQYFLKLRKKGIRAHSWV